jgi:thymidylate synthase (FAD)
LLPEGLTQSTLYMAGSLRSWIHYCELRRGNGTQKEHALIADKCWDIIGVHFPDIVEALND